MDNHDILDENIKKLIKAAGPQRQMPQADKARFLEQLLNQAKDRPSPATTDQGANLSVPRKLRLLQYAAVALLLGAIGLFCIYQFTKNGTTIQTHQRNVSIHAQNILSLNLTINQDGLEAAIESIDKTFDALDEPTAGMSLGDLMSELNS